MHLVVHSSFVFPRDCRASFPTRTFYISTVFFSDKDSVTQIQSFFRFVLVFSFHPFCACIRPKEPVASCWLAIKEEKEPVAGDSTEDGCELCSNAVVLVYEST